MTMLTSLKALLAAPLGRAAKGNATTALGEGGVDFGQMLDVAKGDGSASVAAPIVAARTATPEQPEKSRTVAANISHMALPAISPQHAVLAETSAGQAPLPAPVTDVEAGSPLPVADIDLASSTADTNALLPVPEAQSVSVLAKPIAPLASDGQPEIATAGEAEIPSGQPVSAQIVRDDLIVENQVHEPETDASAIDDKDARPVDADVAPPTDTSSLLAATMPTMSPMPAIQPAPQVMPDEAAKTDGSAPAAMTPVAPAATAPLATMPVAADMPAISTPIAPNISPPSVSVSSEAAAIPVEVSAASPPTGATKPADVQPAVAPMSAAAPQQVEAFTLTPEQPLPNQSKPVPVKAEAVSLLQLVRDHMHGRTAASVGEGNAAGAKDIMPDTVPAALLTMPANGGATVPVSQTPVVAAAQPSVPAAPSVDLSASIGAQVVDMGLSGQWIDGLARDIAGLSANGAQGRFQINTDQLGPVQVDIRQGEDGAAVSLTVATEAAEMALRQDSDRLKIDAALSAVRISEVKVERASQPTESARADVTNNQSGSQSQSQSQSQGQSAGWQGQGMGQSSAQSHMQGRGQQQRENIAFNHKGSSDPAVLNHERAGIDAGDLPRARYA